MKRAVLIILCILLVGCTNKLDQNFKDIDFTYTLNSAGIDKEQYISLLNKELENELDHFTRADYLLILGRLTNDKNKINIALDYYHRALEYTTNLEEKALLYETIASIDTGLARKYYLLRAYDAWKKLGVKWRARIDFNLALTKSDVWQYEISGLKIGDKTKNGIEGKNLLIGGSSIELKEGDLLVTQTDRVSRDWLSLQLNEPFSEKHLKTFSEKLFYSEKELQQETGWHEGARSLEMQLQGIGHKIGSGTIAKRFNGKWYAPNEEGVFMFEIPIDKISYPTTRFLHEDVAVIIDTHGVNSIVEQAIRYKAKAVMACCDSPEKIKAAEYLSKKGIAVICNTDKYLPLLLFSGANVLGSAPFAKEGNKIVVGNRPIEISLDEPIIVQDTATQEKGLGYYDTPSRYFTELEKRGVKTKAIYVEIDDFNQMDKIINKAKAAKAKAIAVRIFNSDDYEKVKTWLEENPERKAILFHSEAYPYGYKLAREFKSQTTFDDINPKIV